MIEPTSILLVENEWIVATTVAEFLSSHGFNVIMKPRAEAALVVLEQRAASISAMVTNMRPGGSMSGIALAHHAARCWPWLTLLIVSGEKPSVLAERPARCDVLSKPCEPAQLLAKLQSALSRKASFDA